MMAKSTEAKFEAIVQRYGKLLAFAFAGGVEISEDGPLPSRLGSKGMQRLRLRDNATPRQAAAFECSVQLQSLIDRTKPAERTAMMSGVICGLMIGQQFAKLSELSLRHEVKVGQRKGGSRTKLVVDDNQKLLLLITYENHRGKKRAYHRTAKELSERHGINGRNGRPLSDRTIARRLKELGNLDNGSVVPGQR